ncbi:MAG: efflux RND transporter periplasmic adaptor subunit [Armatimonadetes bacterium]|nr:efflux RND transporter periplasmic adaptor subunit [Armatimonadota bacterium]
MQSRRAAAVVAVFLGFIMAGCGQSGGDAGKKAAKQMPVPEVMVTKVRRAPVVVTKDFTAQTLASDTVDIRAQVSGQMMNFSFEEGTFITQGQVLFQIDPREYRAAVDQAVAAVAKAQADLFQAQTQVNVKQAEADLASAESQLRKAQLDVDRYKPLAAKQIIPQQQYDDAVTTRDSQRAQVVARQAALENARVNTTAQIGVAKSEVESARAQLEQARVNLGYCTIRSPISGTIGTLNVYPGSIVQPGGEALVTISKSNPIYVTFNVAEADYLGVATRRDDNLERGQGPRVELILVNGQKYPYTGRIVMVDRTLNATTGTLLVRSEFPNPQRILRPGQFGRVRLPVLKLAGAVLVPKVSIVELQSMQTVLVVNRDNKVESRTVVLNPMGVGDDYIVTSGLKGGETVIVDGVQKVQPGRVCKPVPQKTAGT